MLVGWNRGTGTDFDAIDLNRRFRSRLVSGAVATCRDDRMR
jgi:hypothetical protein